MARGGLIRNCSDLRTQCHPEAKIDAELPAGRQE